VIFMAHLTRRTFYIQDGMRPLIQFRNGQRTSRFHTHHIPAIAELLYKGINVLLQKGFSPSHAHVTAPKALNRLKDVGQGIGSALPKRVGGIAPSTAQIAGRQANKRRGQASERGFALHAGKQFDQVKAAWIIRSVFYGYIFWHGILLFPSINLIYYHLQAFSIKYKALDRA
jgi:hypothetical protein